MTRENIAVFALVIIVLVLLWIAAWLMWQPIKRASMVELEVQEFRRQIRDWESANQNDR